MDSIGVVILTLNAAKHIPFLLPPIVNSPVKPKVLIVDSSSTDQTLNLAAEYGVEVLTIARGEFNHGLTREKARKALGTDIVVFLTQDAYFHSNEDLGRLIEPILHNDASLSYARQLPRKNADLFESFPRDFNYPVASHIRNITHIDQWGVYTFFTSNSCAAYRNKALDEVGGFQNVLFGEDTLACAKLLHKGHSIAYAGNSLVEHSHRFTLLQEFKRNFDIGLSRKEIAPLIKTKTGDNDRGKTFAKQLFKRCAVSQFPYAFLHLTSKWLGYKFGSYSHNVPIFIKRALSSQPQYFN